MERQTPAHSSPHAARFRATYTMGLVLGLLALAAAWALVQHRLGGPGLPGCGPGGGCDRAAKSPWATLPGPTVAGAAWPVAFVAAAFFATVVFAWTISASRGVGPALRWALRLGAAASLLYLGVSVAHSIWCAYCLAAHAANLALWLVAERAPRQSARDERSALLALLAAGAFTAVSVSLGFALYRAELSANERARLGLLQSLDEIAQATAQPAPSNALAPFTGRYAVGPADAAVRVVVFSDFACAECRRIDGEVRAAAATLPNVSRAIRHFPFCRDCNPHVPRTLHPDSCRAAAIAEAAGELHGPVGFDTMAAWLFERSGRADEDALDTKLRELRWDADVFRAVMAKPDTLARIRADADEALRLGLNQTPMIFVNGIEVRGWSTPGAVASALRAASAAPPPDTAPATADQKILGDWRAEAVRPAAADGATHTLGPGDAPVQIVLFGDYQEPNSAAADRACRELVQSRGDVRYIFRHFPADRGCNQAVPRTLHPMSCKMSATAEAFAAVGGPDAFWAAHAWLFENQLAFADAGVRELARTLGLEPAAVLAARDASPAAVAADTAAGRSLGVSALPTIYINGKRLARWRLEGHNILADAVQEASQTASPHAAPNPAGP